MSNNYHRLLKRQLKKIDLDDSTLDLIAPLLHQVDEAYKAYDCDLEQVENVLEKSSQELFQTNQQLKNSVESISGQLSKVAGNIKDVIFEMDLNGNWSYLNPAWRKLTGYKVKDCLGKPYYQFLKDEQGNDLKNLIDLRTPNFKTISKSFKSQIITGEHKWLDFSLKVIMSEDGNIEGYIGAIVDISKIKETELALIEAKEKESMANKAKDEFLTTMSHEIRTPLNAVIGISHLLLLENPKPEQLENLSTLKHSSEHLLCLVNDILDFNKIASGQLELEERDFSLNQVLNGLGSIFHNTAKEKDIRLLIKKDTSIPKTFIGDSTRLSQILTNLVSNAIKFTEEGKVKVDIEVLEVKEDFYFLEFVISDTGIGIPEDKKDKIFLSFAQANSDTTRKYGGTGLGLAICKRLLEIMDSDLELESEVGKGSTFSFKLKLQKSSMTDHQEDIYSFDAKSFHEQDNLKGTRILVAEDNKVNIMVIEKFLSKWQVDFEIAENGLIALNKALENTYDMILMDLQMPVMNGFEASKAIRDSNNPLNKVMPIYALSASTGMDIKNQLGEYGIDGLICKPFNPTELFKTLTSILQQKYIQ
ncbi:PAS domain S-box-containing protein [Arenibacter algicola]|uniref:histidine kinase n=1 Tax=Arenibacter algicola TaxID=616991 RepID=A0ABY3A7G7_9FLAO|nr:MULTISPECIES: ATP-binding protein [Arenibacter]GBF19718.1 autoinducer 2 sensor kinase/phosphatase LuxQ [Arenibacter sp. NBRC 103722]HCO84060.1 hybrid sensor histidine kinase/response regulator [Arenibacter sp.]|tara:strand:+ start:3008 stop:4774 length:1767 start_codon:yes stop_codon:yes gene_type:complete|eukprot:TRINITY_DN6068_c0_g3_i1.p1 TRINITY_DN6068_c0_g3~~TRINITY_DN6068_c0_g3_i1.p1  ORF type:complete len:589 (+),score=113.33 TRINITY_DN6068_c0_g3_i1:1167-2933(+)